MSTTTTTPAGDDVHVVVDPSSGERLTEVRLATVEDTDAAVERMREDMVFSLEPAQRDFGYAPRAFKPEARMFERALPARD